MKKILLLFAVFTLCACRAKDAGFITLVNSDTKKIEIFIDKRGFEIFPANHITKEVSAGPHKININNDTPIELNVQKNRTLLFDSSGLSCFIVADFEQMARGGNAMILEKSKHSRIFAPNTEITVMHGAPLPKKPKPGAKLTRIHQVDCETIDDNIALLENLLTD